MRLSFFNAEDIVRKVGAAFHNDDTRRIYSRPDMAKLRSGLSGCGGCGGDIELSGYEPLSISACPGCGFQNFIPARVSKYWLFEPLGGGGMGSVYRACSDDEPETDLAVKVLPRAKRHDQHLICSLLNEAEIGHNIGVHPHLMRVFEFGYADGEYFSVSEYIDGVRLDQVIDSPVPQSERQVVLWALQILSAEQHMFDEGYLFRDLKPQNIIIDGNGNARLIDYGLALSVEEALTDGADSFQGSPLYMPPERIVGSGEAQCSEIYSLGMVMFHILAGETFYSADEVKALVSKHVVDLRMTNVACKLPAETDRDIIKVLNKMLRRRPRERYQTYKEAASALFRVYKDLAA